MLFSQFTSFLKNFTLLIILILMVNCSKLSKTDSRQVPINAQERARKNVEEGRGAGITGIIKNRRQN